MILKCKDPTTVRHNTVVATIDDVKNHNLKPMRV